MLCRRTKQESRLGMGLGERAVFKWVVREGLTKKVILEQMAVGGEGSVGRGFSAEGPAGAKVLRVQSSQEASVAGDGGQRGCLCGRKTMVEGQSMGDLIGH